MIRLLLRVLLLAIAFTIATRGLGWWGVPLTAALWGAIPSFFPPFFHKRGEKNSSLSPKRRSNGEAVSASIAAGLAWAGLLVRDAAFGPLDALASHIGALFHAPPAALMIVTLLYPMVLAWSAAVVTGARRSTPTSPLPPK
jgi:hypothetical protein